MSNHNSVKSNEVIFTEAPASWNTRYVDPNGFECQLTLRADNGMDLLEKVNCAVTYLLDNGCVPYVYRQNGYQAKSGNGKAHSTNGKDTNNHKETNPAWCPIHQCEMKKWERDGRVWFSQVRDRISED